MTVQPVFDGHNDLLARLDMAGGVEAAVTFKTGRPRGHLDAAKARTGGFAGGFFALWVPGGPGRSSNGAPGANAMRERQYDVPLPAMVPQPEALATVRRQIAVLRALEAQGSLTVCADTAAIEAAMASGRIAALMHMEGADAIDPELAVLDDLHRQGLRSLGLVWSRPNRFAEGVPFRFPGSPDTGGGLTPDGRRLVERCNALRVLIDLSHLTEAGFWDVARLSDAPLVATHSNAHALCPHARNLTDRQLDAIAESGGVVGLNFACAFLRDDGRMVRDTPLGLMVDHLAYLVERMGEDHVALGSDFDGAVVPQEVGSAAGLPALIAAMDERGFGKALIAKIATENWLRVLRQTLGG